MPFLQQSDESGMGRDESGARGTNRANLGTNPPRGVTLPPALVRSRHAVWAGLRDSLGLIGPQRPLPAPLAAGTAHGLERLRHVARALFRKLPHRRLKHGPRDHKPPPVPVPLRLLRQNRERRPRSEVIDSGPAW